MSQSSENWESSFLGSVGEGIVLSLFRKSGLLALRLGEGRAQPDLEAKGRDNKMYPIEVRYCEKGILSYRRHIKREERKFEKYQPVLIVVSETGRHCLLVSYPDYPRHGDRMILEPLQLCARFRKQFAIKEDAFGLCEYLVNKYIRKAKKNHSEPPPPVVKESPTPYGNAPRP